jgi:hypothetical protein
MTHSIEVFTGDPSRPYNSTKGSRSGSVQRWLYKFEVYEDKKGEFRFRFKAAQ